jgi:hypothetical protein
MSKIALSGNASGTGTFTIASPNSNSDRTLNLPDAAGTIQVSGNPISGTTGTFTGLVDISAAGAGQSQFPATQNASANANTLDDYEEGTWTPTLSFNGNSVGITYGQRHGLYTKVGNRVTVTCYVAISSKGSSTGLAQVSGLPFSIASGVQNFAPAAIWSNQLSINQGVVTAYGEVNTSRLDFNATSVVSSAAPAVAITDVHFSNATSFMLTFTYVAA